jgi:SAM-dependent methyltransferase
VDWQERYQQGDTPWDKGYATPVLSELVEKKPFFFGSNKRIFVPGCGNGYDAHVLAETGSSVLGFDIAPAAIDTASENVQSGLDLKFDLGDIFNLPGKMEKAFDLVWEHTCFCAIDPNMRAQYVEQMWRALKPNAALLGVFFTNPDMPPGEGPPYRSTRDEVRAVFGSHFVLEWEWEPTQFYPGREGREHVMLFRRLADCSELSCS